MSAAALLERAARQGVTIEVRDGKLKLGGPSWSVHDIAQEVRESKAELLAHLDPPPLSASDHQALREAIEERAAIREHEASQDRETAEDMASAGMRIYRYRLTDHTGWLTMLAPHCTPEEARHDLSIRFGPERLIEVREHRKGVEK